MMYKMILALIVSLFIILNYLYGSMYRLIIPGIYLFAIMIYEIYYYKEKKNEKDF